MARQTVTPAALEKADKKFLWHPFTQQYLWEKTPTLIIRSGRGPYLIDIRGRRYLDAVSSLWVNLHGHNHPVLMRAIRQQLKKIAHSTFLGLSHEPAILLGQALAKVAPKGLTRTFFSDNGATAVEVALKMAFQYWIEKNAGKPSPKKEFLAVKGSYHGDTLGAVSVGGIGAFHSKFKPLLFKTRFAMAPNCQQCPFNKNKKLSRFRTGEITTHVPKPGELHPESGCRWECLGDAEKILKKNQRTIAAAVIEPVIQGASGMNVQPAGYVAGLRRLTKKYNVLLIADEVATGFGRTGRLFACELERVSPDLMCVAKALTGGTTPLAATLATEKIFKTFYGPLARNRTFFHGHSYTGHPLGAAAAVANLRLIEKTKLLEKTRSKAHLLKDELHRLKDLLHVGSIRQAGLMAGIELVAEKTSGKPFPASLRMGARVCQRLLTMGIWMRPLGDTLVVMPPPVISPALLRKLMTSVRRAILHECKT